VAVAVRDRDPLALGRLSGTSSEQESSAMTQKKGFIGTDTGKSSDKYLSPQNPQTGNGWHTRIVHDKVRLDNPPRDPSK
jgi:hypothetical protein